MNTRSERRGSTALLLMGRGGQISMIWGVLLPPGAQAGDVKRKLSLVPPLKHFPLMVFQVGSDEIRTRSLKGN